MLPDSDRISPVPPYLSINSPIIFSFRVQDYYPLWSHFPECSTKKKLIGPDLIESAYLATPLLKKKRFRHHPFSLATTNGISIDLFSSWY